MQTRVVLISPVRNEALHLVRTARALQAQTRPPDLWLVVDDNSDDETPELLRGLEAEIPFMRAMATPSRHTQHARDRLALAAEARAFNFGLATLGDDAYTHIGKLDGDIELPPEYFERMLEEFAADPGLGIAGGVLLEPGRSGSWVADPVPDYHVRGALKLYSRACFEAIGGMEERLGWDTIDETYARMRGFVTRNFRDVVALHHRPLGTADGALRGRARHGECAYILHYGLLWVTVRSLKEARLWPAGISGAAFLYGYLRAALRSQPRVEDDEFRRFVRRELRGRMLRPLETLKPHLQVEG